MSVGKPPVDTDIMAQIQHFASMASRGAAIAAQEEVEAANKKFLAAETELLKARKAKDALMGANQTMREKMTMDLEGFKKQMLAQEQKAQEEQDKLKGQLKKETERAEGLHKYISEHKVLFDEEKEKVQKGREARRKVRRQVLDMNKDGDPEDLKTELAQLQNEMQQQEGKRVDKNKRLGAIAGSLKSFKEDNDVSALTPYKPTQENAAKLQDQFNLRYGEYGEDFDTDTDGYEVLEDGLKILQSQRFEMPQTPEQLLSVSYKIEEIEKLLETDPGQVHAHRSQYENYLNGLKETPVYHGASTENKINIDNVIRTGLHLLKKASKKVGHDDNTSLVDNTPSVDHMGVTSATGMNEEGQSVEPSLPKTTGGMESEESSTK
jgi:hypothetical protein